MDAEKMEKKPEQITEEELDGFDHIYRAMIEQNHLHRVVKGYYWEWEEPEPEDEGEEACIIAETLCEEALAHKGLIAVKALLDKLIESGAVEVTQ